MSERDPICPERGIPQSECPPFCPHDFGRLETYVAEYVNDSPAVLRVRATEAQWNALEMARKAAIAERRAEEAEFHVEQLRDARDRAERRIERACEVLDEWEHDGPKGYEFHLLILRVREALDGAVRACRRCGCGVDGDVQCPCGCDEPNECDHQWLDRPESDTRECLICGTEATA